MRYEKLANYLGVDILELEIDLRDHIPNLGELFNQETVNAVQEREIRRILETYLQW